MWSAETDFFPIDCIANAEEDMISIPIHIC
jgi:hypothetical protein